MLEVMHDERQYLHLPMQEEGPGMKERENISRLNSVNTKYKICHNDDIILESKVTFKCSIYKYLSIILFIAMIYITQSALSEHY